MDRTGVLAEAEPQQHTYTYRLNLACWKDDKPRLGRLEWTIDGESLTELSFHPDLLLNQVEQDSLRQALAYCDTAGFIPVFRSGEWIRDLWRQRVEEDRDEDR